MAHIEDVLLSALSQAGDRYIFGAEVDPGNPNPTAFDCSELVQYACDRAGVTPKMPDGSGNQYVHCVTHKTIVSVATAITTRGALLFMGNPIHHVAMSLGNHTTIEARGRKWGVGSFTTVARPWNHGALIPGVSYQPGRHPLPTNKPPQEETMPITVAHPKTGFTVVFPDGHVNNYKDNRGAAPDYLGGMNLPKYQQARHYDPKTPPSGAYYKKDSTGYALVITYADGAYYEFPSDGREAK